MWGGISHLCDIANHHHFCLHIATATAGVSVNKALKFYRKKKDGISCFLLFASTCLKKQRRVMLENGKKMPFNIFLKVIHAERNLRIYSSLGKNNNHHKGTKPTHRPPNPEHIREQKSLQPWWTERCTNLQLKSDSRRKESLVASCLETVGSHILKFKGLFKSMVVCFGDQKIQVEANKEQAKKNSQSCETLLFKIMTEIYDCFLPGRKKHN